MSVAPLSEFDAIPDAVIVHDPSATGVFNRMRAAQHSPSLFREFLFGEMPDEALFRAQHRGFVEAIERAGITVHYLPSLLDAPADDRISSCNPNQVYTRDPLLTLPWSPRVYVTCTLKPPIRHQEHRALRQACRTLGLQQLTRLQEPMWLEGGDLIPFVRDGRRSLLFGYGPRSTRAAAEALRERLIPEFLDEIIAIELSAARINLDGGLLPVADDVLIAHPDSLLSAMILDRQEYRVDVLSMFRELGFRVVEVSFEESRRQQACNCLCLGKRRIICYDLSSRVVKTLRALDLDVTAVPGSELVKGTGGPRCMSRPVYAPSAGQSSGNKTP